MRVKYVDYEQYLGWYPEEVIRHFKEGFSFEIDECTTVADLVKLIKSKLEPLYSYADSSFPGDRSIMIKREKTNVRYYLDECSVTPFAKLIEFLKVDDEIPIFVSLIIGGRGEAFHKEGMNLGVTFLFHSDEGNHLGRPHVHVIDRNNFAEISIDLNTLKTIDHKNTKNNTRFSGKKMKKAISFVTVHLTEFLGLWNETTNGFQIEIDA